MLASQHAWECTHREPEPGHVESVFRVVGVVGREVLMCGELRSKTGMLGKHTSLPVTERGAAALGALDGTYLVCRDVSALETSNARATRLHRLIEWEAEVDACCVGRGMGAWG